MDTVLFDLDGTLLPLDPSRFATLYAEKLTDAVAAYTGLDKQATGQALLSGIDAMMHNDGQKTNRERFWDAMAAAFGDSVRDAEPALLTFYENEFETVRVTASPTKRARRCIRLLLQKGYRLVLATNPLFPRAATLARIRWAGLDAADFTLITTYEDSRRCKPDPAYFEDILQCLHTTGDRCLMVGNDVTEDLCAETVGMDTYLVTDCLINRESRPLDAWKHGGFSELEAYLRSLPAAR